MVEKEYDFYPVRVFYDEADGAGDGDAGGDGEGSKPAGEVKPEGDDGQAAAQAFDFSNWRDQLDPDLREHTGLAKIGNKNPINEMARSFVSAQKMVGKDPNKLFEMPGVEDEAGRTGILRQLGAPESPDGYTLTAVEKAPDWLGPDQELATGFKDVAAKLGMLPGQVQSVFSWFGEAMTQANNTQEEEKAQVADDNIKALEKEWGEAFDQNSAAANFAIDKLGGKELLDALNAADVGHLPVVLKAFSQVGKLLAEDTTGGEGGDPPNFSGALSPAEAKAKGQDLLRQAQRLPVSEASERKRINVEAQRFFKMASGGK